MLKQFRKDTFKNSGIKNFNSTLKYVKKKKKIALRKLPVWDKGRSTVERNVEVKYGNMNTEVTTSGQQLKLERLSISILDEQCCLCFITKQKLNILWISFVLNQYVMGCVLYVEYSKNMKN